jgi:hypothetical protein
VTEAAETQIELVDPRAYGHGADDALVALASASVPGERSARATLIAAMRAHLLERDDVAIAASFSSAPGQGVRLRLLEALKAAIDDPDSHETDGLLTRVFAIPVLLVTGGKPGAVVPSVVPDAAAVTAILRQHGALGHTENFGLSATLATAETLESLRPSLLYRWTRSIGPEGAANRELIGTDILVESADECVHLRFLVGASVAPAQGLSFVESASRVGGWGMPVTRELASQFERDGLAAFASAEIARCGGRQVVARRRGSSSRAQRCAGFVHRWESRWRCFPPTPEVNCGLASARPSTRR